MGYLYFGNNFGVDAKKYFQIKILKVVLSITFRPFGDEIQLITFRGSL